jgi:hypothetical protein
MDDAKRLLMARALLGNSMPGQASDMTKLSQQYDKMLMDGQEMPAKSDWIKMQMMPQPQQFPTQVSNN